VPNRFVSTIVKHPVQAVQPLEYKALLSMRVNAKP